MDICTPLPITRGNATNHSNGQINSHAHIHLTTIGTFACCCFQHHKMHLATSMSEIIFISLSTQITIEIIISSLAINIIGYLYSKSYVGNHLHSFDHLMIIDTCAFHFLSSLGDAYTQFQGFNPFVLLRPLNDCNHNIIIYLRLPHIR